MLRTKTPLRAKRSLRDSYAEKLKSGQKTMRPLAAKKQYKPKVKVKKLKLMTSILTADMTRCYITGDVRNIHIHHIFGAANKTNSEKYGFLVPLRDDWHNMSDYGVHFNKELDLKLKTACEEYWLQNYGTREEFIAVFGRWW